MLFEAGRQLHLGHLDAIKTIRLLAFLAEEVGVQVVVVVIVVTMAELVASAVASTLDGMYQMVFAE